MYISDLALYGFRSYSEVRLQFEPGITVLMGENGQGKTNIIEAIAYLSTLSSHRVAADTALVNTAAQKAIIQARSHYGETSTTLEVEIIQGKANRARLNRGNCSPSALLGVLRNVVFSPEDLDLVRSEPGIRRRFLDDVMIQMRPRLASVRSEYDKVLRQRAALLKTLGKNRRAGRALDFTTLDIWDGQLARLAARITAARMTVVAALTGHVREAYEAVSAGKSEADIIYSSSIMGEIRGEGSAVDTDMIEARHRELLLRERDKEIERGVNLVGPHRDDLLLRLGNLPAKGYASHGECWSLALALRLASWHVLHNDIAEDLSYHPLTGDGLDDAAHQPVLILDDVFAELDSRRRDRLAELILPAQQVFITAAVGNDIPPILHEHIFRVHGGNVVKEESAPLAGAAPQPAPAPLADAAPLTAATPVEEGSDE